MTIIPVSAISFVAQWDASQSYGTPVMTNQKLEFLDGAAVVRTDNVGLPTAVNNKINFTVPIAGLPVNKSLKFRVLLIGPGGTTTSPELVDPFVLVDAPINIAAPIIIVN